MWVGVLPWRTAAYVDSGNRTVEFLLTIVRMSDCTVFLDACRSREDLSMFRSLSRGLKRVIDAPNTP